MKENSIQVATKFVDKYFPDSLLALLSGSIARNEQTITSDLDILIICNRIECPYKESFYDFHWPIEAFVHTEQSVLQWMENNKKQKKCSMAKIISDGIVLKDLNNIFANIKSIAEKILITGPDILSEKEDADRRYIITDYLDDLIGSDDYYEQIIIVNELIPEILNYKLLKDGKWQSKGKYLYKFSKELSNNFYLTLMRHLEIFYKTQVKDDLISFINSELEKNGGRYFAGHKT